MFWALALLQNEWQRANAWNVGFETFYGGQLMISTQLIILNYSIYMYTSTIVIQVVKFLKGVGHKITDKTSVETIFLQAYESLTFWNGTRLTFKKKKKFIFLVNVAKSALTCLQTHILWYFPHKITLKEANGLEKYDTCTCIWTWFEFRTGIHLYWSSFISTAFFHGRMQDWWPLPLMYNRP